MSKYEIEINVNQRVQKSGGASPTSESMAELRERIQQAKTMEQSRESDVKKSGTSESRRRGKDLMDFFNRVQTLMRDYIKNNQLLIRGLETLSSSMRKFRIGGGGGEGGATGGGFMQSVATAASNIHIVGAAAGAIAASIRWGWERVVEVGTRHNQLALQQLMTEKLGGFQYSGLGVYSAAQMGEMTHARVLAGGRFARGDESRRPGGLAATYGGLFGIGANEVGRLIGGMDIISGGRGESSFARSIAYARRGGIETELPLLLNAISETLQEAVRAGVSDSSLAEDMAQEVGMVMRVAPTSSVQSAIATQRNLMQLQNQVARGRLGSLEEWEMYRASQSFVEEQIRNPQNTEFISAALSSGILSQQQLDTVRAGGELPVEARDALIRFASQRMPAAVRSSFLRNIVETYGGEGTETERAQRAMWFMAGNMPSLMEGSPAQTIQALIAAMRSNEVAPNFNLPDGDEAVTAEAKNALDVAVSEHAAGVQVMQNKLEALTLGEAGQAAGQAVLNFQTNMVNLASRVQDIVIPAIGALDAAMSGLAKGTNWLIGKIQGLSRN